MNSGNLLTIGSIFYSILLIMIFLAKKKIKSLENNLYSILIITNFIGLIIAIACFYTVKNYEIIPITNYIISRLYLIYLVTYIFVFSLYLVAVLYEQKKASSNIMKKTITALSLVFLIIIILIFKLELYYHNENGIIYSYGPAANLIYIVATISMITWSVLLIKNIKKAKNKKVIPIVMFIFMAMIITIIQKLNPGLLLMTSMETFIVVLMYFTIENPDLMILKEIHDAKEYADNSNYEKEMFLFNMSQDIKQINTAIYEDANQILEITKSEEVKDISRDIISYTAKYNTLVNDILDVSNIDNVTKIYNTEYNIKLLLKQIITIVGSTNKQNISFKHNISQSLPVYLYGDGITLKEIVIKMIQKSIHNTENGYVELNVDTIIKKDICRLIINIEDSSIGIKANEIDQIMATDKELAKAKKELAIMGGTIFLASNYQKGTKTTIVLDQKRVNKKEIEDKYETIYKYKKILICDDNESSQKIFEKLLSNENIDIIKCNTGKSCLEKIRNKEKYDLIFIDETVGVMSSKEVMVKLKEIKNFNIPVILLTKDTNIEYSNEYQIDGFTTYLIKPIKKEQLIEIINKF